MKFGGNKYGTQLISIEERYKEFMHDMKKIAVDATFNKMAAKKCIKRKFERAILFVYKEYL